MSVQPLSPNSASQVTGAIREAAQSTGTSFQYLLATAQIESSLNPSAQASTSSAQGLFQFIEQTWLATIKEAGPSLGYGKLADAIVPAGNGQYQVTDPLARKAIMRLRADPATSAAMAGAFTRKNAMQVAGQIGRMPSEGELYMAHFLGPDGAAKLIAASSNQPLASAARMFPGAASANRSIFFDRMGRARSTSEVYAVLDGRYKSAAAYSQRGKTAIASAETQPVPRPPASIPTPKTPDIPPVAQASAVVPPSEPKRVVADNRPLFESMFTTEAPRAVAPVVASLWDGRTAAAQQAADKARFRPLELFQDPGSENRPKAREIFSNKA